MRRLLPLLLLLPACSGTTPTSGGAGVGGAPAGGGSSTSGAASSSSSGGGSSGTSSGTTGSSSSSGSGNTSSGAGGDGTLTGQGAFGVATAWEKVIPTDGGTLTYAGVHLYDQALGCSAASGNNTASYVDARVFGMAPVVPGTYPIIPGSYDGGHGRVTVSLSLPDGGSQSLKGFSGSITLVSVDATRVVGSFDAMVGYPDGGSIAPLSGTFDAPVCPGLN